MKKAFYTIIALLLALCLVGCDVPDSQALLPGAETVYDKETGEKSISGTDVLNYGTWDPNLSDTTLIPWSGDVKNLAMTNGSVSDPKPTLRFYFMASEGTEISGNAEKIGDSCLVVFPTGETMLIDTGAGGDYTDTLITNLKRLGISKLDYVVISHPHNDHYTGFTATGTGIADNSSITVGKVYIHGITGHNGISTIKNAASRNSIPVETLQEGDTLTIGDVSIKILNPTKDATTTEYPNATEGVNNSSICMMFTYGTVKALFVGDLYKSGMQAVAERYGNALKADILKIPHHGHSETSINNTFASYVKPSIAVASSGITLSSAVYKLYHNVGAELYNDYNNGYIIISTDGSKIYTKTSRVFESDYYDVYNK